VPTTFIKYDEYFYTNSIIFYYEKNSKKFNEDFKCNYYHYYGDIYCICIVQYISSG